MKSGIYEFQLDINMERKTQLAHLQLLWKSPQEQYIEPQASKHIGTDFFFKLSPQQANRLPVNIRNLGNHNAKELGCIDLDLSIVYLIE